MSKIENRPSEAVQKPHEDVAAEVCTDANMLSDKELDTVAGGYMKYRFQELIVSSYSPGPTSAGGSDCLSYNFGGIE
jgi:hypothetical protein